MRICCDCQFVWLGLRADLFKRGYEHPTVNEEQTLYQRLSMSSKDEKFFSIAERQLYLRLPFVSFCLIIIRLASIGRL